MKQILNWYKSIFLMVKIKLKKNLWKKVIVCLKGPPLSPSHKFFKCWWLALPKQKRITKPLINSTLDHGLHEGPSYTILTIIKELELS